MGEVDAQLGKYGPTIFVACGGAGAKICQRIRRLTLERLGGLGPEVLPGVAYLSIDTDMSSVMANHQGEDFGALAPLLDFRPEERVELDGTGFKDVVRSEVALASHPHIAEWFDPMLIEAAKGIDLSRGAGQIRPIGRLAAFLNHERILAGFAHAYREVTSIRADSGRCMVGDRVHVVICGSLAGGTGAGIFQDVAALIRESHPAVSTTGVFVLPDAFASVERASHVAKIQANGHACLAELAHHTVHPFQASYDGRTVVSILPNNPLFNELVLLEGTNAAGRSARTPAEVYDVAAQSLFLGFVEGEYGFAHESISINRAQLRLRSHRETVPVKTASGELVKVDLETYRAAFQSQGSSRLETHAWSHLQRMTAWLAGEVLDHLNPVQDIGDEEEPLVRELAQALGIWRGEADTEDGSHRDVDQLRDRLLRAPEGDSVSTLLEAVERHFADFTDPVAQQVWWDARDTGDTIRKRFLAMTERWAQASDGKPGGASVECVATNARDLLQAAQTALPAQIEALCERPGVGPHRAALVLRALAKRLREAWVPDIEAHAERWAARASHAKQELDRWFHLVSAVDTRFHGNVSRVALDEQLHRLQESAVAHWSAVAEQAMCQEALVVLRELAAHLEAQGADPREQVAPSLQELRDTYSRLERDYAKGAGRGGHVLGEAEDGIEPLRQHFLGNPGAERKASLRVFLSRVCAYAGASSSEELLERAMSDHRRFVADLWRACWLALRGARGVTDAFGPPRQALPERESFYAALRRAQGEGTSLQTLARDLLERALPWVKPPEGASMRLTAWDLYVLVPRAAREDVELRRALLQAVDDAASGFLLNVASVQGADCNAVTCVTCVVGLVPAQFGAMGAMAAAAKAASAWRRAGDLRGWIHVVRDRRALPLLLPLTVEEGEARVHAWKLLLLGTIRGQVLPRNPIGVRGGASAGDPEFLVPQDPGQEEPVALGPARDAVEELAKDLGLQTFLRRTTLLVEASAAERVYPRLAALVRYYRCCIFPSLHGRDPDTDEKLHTRPMAWVALCELEAELREYWCESVPEAERAGWHARVAELVAELPHFTELVGAAGEEPVVTPAHPTDRYAEVPPASFDDDRAGEVRREALLEAVRALVPPHARGPGSKPAYPWLRLSADWRVTHGPPARIEPPPPPPPPHLAPPPFPPPPPPPPLSGPVTAAFVVEHARSGHRITVPSGFDAGELRRLLAALG